MIRRALALTLMCSLWLAPGAHARGKPSTANAETPVPVAASDRPPPGRRLSPNQVLDIAERLPRMRAERAKHPGSYGGAYLKGPRRWQVSYFSKQNKEIGQVIIADATGRVLEQWTGFQIAWDMARGYPGSFGRHVDALYIWLPLCLLFFVPFFDWRRPLRLLHLDLLVLLSFSISLAFFNHANIGMSTPLAYPPLVYLLARMLWLVRRPRTGRGSVRGRLLRPPAPATNTDGGLPAAGPGRPLRLLVPAPWLAVGVVFLLGFRIGLNMIDSNVIDVGYAGVIGAQRIVQDRPLYGHYPSDNEHGDTYGPANYEAYVPFQQVFGFSGRWDDLLAAHAAAIAFDLLAVALLFLLGRRARGPGLGIALAYAWVSYPFTAFALESNSNDALVAVFVLGALLAAARAPLRGALGALAGLTKFAPLALAPLLATYRPRRLSLFALGFLLAAALACIPAFTHDSLATFVDRTLTYQANRESPFSIWGFYGGLGDVQAAVLGGALALAVALVIVPRRSDLVGLAAACAAVLIALQLAASHWFYLYIPWFFGLAMLAMLGSLSPPQEAREGVASSPARSSRLAAV